MQKEKCDSRVWHLLVVVRAVKGETSEASLDVIAGLSIWTVVGASCTFINIWQKTNKQTKEITTPAVWFWTTYVSSSSQLRLLCDNPQNAGMCGAFSLMSPFYSFKQALILFLIIFTHTWGRKGADNCQSLWQPQSAATSLIFNEFLFSYIFIPKLLLKMRCQINEWWHVVE